MSRVVTQADVEAVPQGGTLSVEADAAVTPLAVEHAAARGVRILRHDGGGDARGLVREVTRAVVSRLGEAGPQVIEAVVAEVLAALGPAAAAPVSAGGTVTTARGATLLPLADGASPGVDYCMACVEQERARQRRRAVLTTTGKNTKGIVARVTARIADLGGDILDISQTLVGDFFTMIIVIDVGSLSVSFEQFQDEVSRAVREMGCQAMMMHEDVLTSLHRV
jgi:ACT domain-containing protein